MSTARTETCANCRHWERERQVETDGFYRPGSCHRNAPTHDSDGSWPPVAFDQWCGEWAPTDQALEAKAKEFNETLQRKIEESKGLLGSIYVTDLPTAFKLPDCEN